MSRKRGATMKIKSLAAICKRRKNIVLFHDGSDQQYISDGNAVYPVFGLPELNTDYILTIFDVPEKDRDKYITRETTLPDGINLSDDDYSERAVISIPISIAYGGTPLRPLKTTGGIVYIDSRYLSPLADMLDVLELYERRTTAGELYIAAKAGFLLQAVILPHNVIEESFVDRLSELAALTEETFSRQRAKAERGEMPGQVGLNVDPATGEVVEGE